MNQNLNDNERSRLGNANLEAFFSHLNFLVDNPEEIDTIPNSATVIYQGTGDAWVNAQNDKLADQAVANGEKIHRVRLHNPHAGEILKYEFLEELNISENSLAAHLGVPDSTIKGIIEGKLPITADIDLRLCRYFRLTEGYFLRLQNVYELMQAKRSLGEILNQIIPYSSAVGME